MTREPGFTSRTAGWPKGFTLIEVLVVIGIIAILAGLLLPVLAKTRQNARLAVAKEAMQSISVALESYRSDWGVYPDYIYYSGLNGAQEDGASQLLAKALCVKQRPWFKSQKGEILQAETNYGPYLHNLSPAWFKTEPGNPEYRALLSPLNNTQTQGFYKYVLTHDPLDVNKKLKCLVIDAGLDGMWGGDTDEVQGFVPSGEANSNDVPAWKDNIFSGDVPSLRN